MDLPERLDLAAETSTSMGTANLLRTAAATLRVQANRIADLEKEVERLIRVQSQLDEEINLLEAILAHYEKGLS